MKRLVVLIASAIVFFALLGSLTYEATKADVKVQTDDKETKSVRTHADTVGELLESLKINVQSHDKLSHKLEDPITTGMEIDYQSAKPVTVTIDDQETQYYTTADTVKQFMDEKEINISERDQVSHKDQANIESGMNINVQKAFQVALNDGGEEKKVWTTAGTVGEFLNQQEISLNKHDELNRNKKAELSKQQASVTITRIEKVTDVVEEQVDYAVVTRKDNSMPKGNKKVVQNGEEGKVVKHYEVTMKNGEEVDRKLVKEETAKDSKKKIVAVGTKVIQQTASRSNSSDNVQKTLYMEATAYTAYCDGCSGITNTGINLRANPNKKVIAVDPNVIPLGSRVWVEGYGYAVAGDIGSAIKGNRIDVFVPSRSDALSFGRRKVQVKILGN